MNQLCKNVLNGDYRPKLICCETVVVRAKLAVDDRGALHIDHKYAKGVFFNLFRA